MFVVPTIGRKSILPPINLARPYIWNQNHPYPLIAGNQIYIDGVSVSYWKSDEPLVFTYKFVINFAGGSVVVKDTTSNPSQTNANYYNLTSADCIRQNAYILGYMTATNSAGSVTVLASVLQTGLDNIGPLAVAVTTREEGGYNVGKPANANNVVILGWGPGGGGSSSFAGAGGGFTQTGNIDISSIPVFAITVGGPSNGQTQSIVRANDSSGTILMRVSQDNNKNEGVGIIKRNGGAAYYTPQGGGFGNGGAGGGCAGSEADGNTGYFGGYNSATGIYIAYGGNPGYCLYGLAGKGGNLAHDAASANASNLNGTTYGGGGGSDKWGTYGGSKGGNSRVMLFFYNL